MPLRRWSTENVFRKPGKSDDHQTDIGHSANKGANYDPKIFDVAGIHYDCTSDAPTPAAMQTMTKNAVT